MSRKLKETFNLDYTESNQKLPQSIPREIIETDTTSELAHLTTQLVSSSAHELLDYGDLSDDVVCYLKNNDAAAIVKYGVDVGATFYPVGQVHPGKRVRLGILEDVTATYVKSDVNDSELEVQLYKIAS